MLWCIVQDPFHQCAVERYRNSPKSLASSLESQFRNVLCLWVAKPIVSLCSEDCIDKIVNRISVEFTKDVTTGKKRGFGWKETDIRFNFNSLGEFCYKVGTFWPTTTILDLICKIFEIDIGLYKVWLLWDCPW